MHFQSLLFASVFAFTVHTAMIDMGDRPWFPPQTTKHPTDFSYFVNGPVYNVSDFQLYISTDDTLLNSHWVMHWMTTTTGLDLMVLSHTANRGNYTVYGASVFELKTKVYKTYEKSGVTLEHDPKILNWQYETNEYAIYANTPDSFSSITSWINAGGLEFNITFEPTGPNLYDGGPGIFEWGADFTREWAAPSAYTTGSITINGTLYEIDPSRSTSWYDRQFGPGIASSGWLWFPVALDNGLRMCIWATLESANGRRTFATVLHPDGHQEIHPIDPDVKLSQPWVSKDTNSTYYGHLEVNFPDNCSVLNFTLPNVQQFHYGENLGTDLPTTTYEGFTEISGIWDGEIVKGFGCSEQLINWR